MDKRIIAHAHNGIYLDVKNKMMSFAGKWVDSEFIILSKIDQIHIKVLPFAFTEATFTYCI